MAIIFFFFFSLFILKLLLLPGCSPVMDCSFYSNLLYLHLLARQLSSASERYHTYYLSGMASTLQIPSSLPTMHIKPSTSSMSYLTDCTIITSPHTPTNLPLVTCLLYAGRDIEAITIRGGGHNVILATFIVSMMLTTLYCVRGFSYHFLCVRF